MMPVQPTAELIKSLQAIVEALFESTSADRTTIRVDVPNDPDFPVLAEARIEGMASITGGMSLKGYKPVDFHATPTTRHLRDRREMIIQGNVTSDPPEMPLLVDFYGIRAQMLHPLEHDGDFVGLVSVHSIEPREWSSADITALKSAVRRVQSVLDGAIWIAMARGSGA